MPKKKLLWLLAGIGGAALVLALPIVHATIVVLNLIVHFVVLGLQLVSARLPRFRPERQPRLDEDAFVSTPVPAPNEPPELLKQTLRALSELKWKNYEVLVIDNNTTDEALWKPIEACCQELGPKFRF